ncbi:heme transporter hrg1-A [Biomphalaria glabrata]|uniref:Heme transporter hrg1-A-like n=1 Tax=Biomphalaria glabrata TaxID=6526 RepID=A0A2C9M3I4_BIOGL|nr:heme transporter hrg1-A-like [Biomphalaria glabrata]KAI8728242.1 heme transporter hrg1-A-like [Biomphalaria glabrata]KAI8767243.1 heme transporter hrg1-A [Biomphalaria glabrata]
MDEPVGRITGWPLKLRIIFSSIGIFVGVSVFIVFSTHYKNYNTGLWALVSGLAAAIALGVTIAYHKRAWDSNPMCLKSFMLLGCFIQLAGVCGLVAYLVLGITKQDGLVIYGTDYYLTCVWCFMTWKWGLGILLYSRSFLRSYTERGRLLNDDAEIAKKAYNVR